MFNGIFASASKIVLLLFAVTICIGLVISKLDAKDFLVLASMVFTYYFSTTSPKTSNPDITDKP